MKTIFPYYFICIIIFFSSCKPNLKITEPDKGDLDASKYVAIGGSMTAGYADGALYHEAQRYSFANILAGQLSKIGASDFSVPYLNESSAGLSVIYNNTITIAAKFILSYKTDCKSVSSLSPVRLSPTDTYYSFNKASTFLGPYQNLGVPDVKSFQVAYNGLGNPSNNSTGYYNPYFHRFASNTNTSILLDAVIQNPTFFTLEIGLHDILYYALSGGAHDSITPQFRFDAAIDNIVNRLTTNDAKGAIAGIPDFTKLPFFTTIPYNGLTLDSAKANSLNLVYNPIGFDTVFHAGANNFMISDAAAPLGFRQIMDGELILLNTPLDSVKCFSIGSLIPIANKNVLTLSEIQQIKSAISAFNLKLQSVANTKGLAYVDIDAMYNSLIKGVIYNGVTINAQFVKGGSISLDGIQLNPIGNAILANEYIKAINSTYHSSIPYAEVTKYRGTIFP